MRNEKTRVSLSKCLDSAPAVTTTSFSALHKRYRITLTRADEAAANFTNGFSCSQAVCLAFADDFNIDSETALKLSCALGGGMAHSGNTCGAVTGALMVIGMKYGCTRLDDLEAKDKTYSVANAFITEFMNRNHSLNCTDLIGHNLSDPKALAIAREKKTVSHEMCKFCAGCRGDSGRSPLIFKKRILVPASPVSQKRENLCVLPEIRRTFTQCQLLRS